MIDNDDFLMMPIPVHAYRDVCALLGGVGSVHKSSDRPQTVSAANFTPVVSVADAPSASVVEVSPPVDVQTEGNVELDAHGWPWSADLHASTKGKTKEGLWRMKIGCTRPDPKPGFPSEESQETTTVDTVTEPAGGTQIPEQESVPVSQDGSPNSGEDDEFAAFRAADAEIKAREEAAKASVPARKWTDADLSKLCNQAAVELGDPSPIKEIIAEFTPQGEVAHSRNIPDDMREDFAKALEAKANIVFSG